MTTNTELVTTIDGTRAPRANCRKMQGNYYIIGDPTIEGSGQCYKVKGKYRRLETGYIVYDTSRKEYVLASESNLVKAVVAVTADGELEFGNIEQPEFPMYVNTLRGERFLIADEDIFKKSRIFRYSPTTDQYHHIETAPASHFLKLAKIPNGYKGGLDYNAENSIKKGMKAFAARELECSAKVTALAPYLKDLSFGWEFETVAGMVPQRLVDKYNLIPLRDGSVQGLEYATIPYSGVKGLQATVDVCNILDRHTRYDSNCSLHLHIGNLPRTEEFFLALFKTLALIQDDIFDLFPLYKKYNFGVKRKNYTKPLPATDMFAKLDPVINSKNIKQNFGYLYQFLSAGQPYSDVGSDIDNITHHPSDPRGDRKWYIKSRYYWVNMIPLLFGNKQTVEFRIHTPSTDADVVSFYLFICTAIINFVKENTSHILGSRDTYYVSLDNILSKQLANAPINLLDYILSYMANRRRSVLQDNSEGNIRGKDKIKFTRMDIDKSKKPKPTRNRVTAQMLETTLAGMSRPTTVRW